MAKGAYQVKARTGQSQTLDSSWQDVATLACRWIVKALASLIYKRNCLVMAQLLHFQEIWNQVSAHLAEGLVPVDANQRLKTRLQRESAVTLRRRILIIIGATLVALIVGFYGVSSLILLRDFASLEKGDVTRDVKWVEGDLMRQSLNLNDKLSYWAVWDETYQFVEDRNQNFSHSHLDDTDFIELQVNFIVFVNSKGQVVWSKGFDPDSRKTSPVPPSFLRLLNSGSPLLRHASVDSVHAGTVLLAEGPALVVSRPIVTSHQTGPIRGSVIFGRFLDTKTFRRIADMAHVVLTVYPIDDPQLPADFRQARTELHGKGVVRVQIPENDFISGYAIWNDVFGKPSLLLRVDMPREIFMQGHKTIQYLVTWLLMIGLCFGLAMVVLMERLVLARLSRLIADVNRIRASGDVGARVTVGGSDELAGLADALNKMLGALQQSQGELQESQRQLSSLMSNLPGMVYRCHHDEECNIEFASEGSGELTGYQPEEFQGNKKISHTQLIHPEDRERVRREVSEAVSINRPFQVQYRMITARGETKRVWEEGRGVISPNGTVEFREGFISDVTQQKLAADRLRLQGAALESAANAIVLADCDGVVEWVNPAYSKLTGYSFSEAYGEEWSLLKSKNLDQSTSEEIWKTILAGEVWQGELVNRRKDGTLYTERMTITPVEDDRGEIAHFIAIKEDITEQKNLQEQILQAQKVEAVGRLAGGVAHDFNNILTAIGGYAELMMRRLSSTDPLYRHADQVCKATERASGLTRQLLAFSRKQTLLPRVLDLSNAVAEIEKMLRRLIGEDIELHTIRGAAIGHVKADPAQIEQVILNLALNARDAMPKGGKLIIEVANATLGEDYTRLHVGVLPGEYVLLTVADTGIGMKEEVKEHIFEPFFTTKPQGEGTGLGLATCYGIVKQSGGHIDVRSEFGRGTTFEIYLPRVEASTDIQPEQPKLQQLPSGQETILVAEDEPGVRKLSVDVLRSLGYHVIEAGNGEEGIRAAKEDPEEKIDLLFTDVVMPQMDGKQLADWFEATRPATKVLFTSGYTADAILRRGIVEDRIAFLEKPYTPVVLAKRIREILDGEVTKSLPGGGSNS
jgi:PAS domain S-box-containing protein